MKLRNKSQCAVRKGLALAALLSVALVSQGYAVSIVNGDFQLEVPSNGTGNGWTSSNIHSIGGWNSVGHFGAYSFLLNDTGGSSDPTITQTLTGLVPIGHYQVSGEYALQYAGGSAADSFGVGVDGISMSTFGPPTGVGTFTYDFWATTTSHVLRIAAEMNGSNHSYRVDNISISYLDGEVSRSVPDNGNTFLLLGASLLVGWFFQRRMAVAA